MRVKLIRDRMEISQGGYTQCANTRPGKQLALLNKLAEEADEIARDATNAEEYGDMLEVMLELASMNGVTPEQIEAAMLEKRERLGGFKRGRVWIVE